VERRFAARTGSGAARGGRLTSDRVDGRTRALVTLMIVRIPAVAAVSVALAFVNRYLALWSWLLVSALGGLIRSYRRAQARRGELLTPDRPQSPTQVWEKESFMSSLTTP